MVAPGRAFGKDDLPESGIRSRPTLQCHDELRNVNRPGFVVRRLPLLWGRRHPVKAFEVDFGAKFPEAVAEIVDDSATVLCGGR